MELRDQVPCEKNWQSISTAINVGKASRTTALETNDPIVEGYCIITNSYRTTERTVVKNITNLVDNSLEACGGKYSSFRSCYLVT